MKTIRIISCGQPSAGQGQGYDVPTQEHPQTVLLTIEHIAQSGRSVKKPIRYHHTMKKGSLFIHGSICLGIFLIGFGPIIIAVTASAIASIAGCTLDEGSANPCLIFAVDVGETLYSMAMLGWITRATLPVAAALFVIYGIVTLVLRLMNRTG